MSNTKYPTPEEMAKIKELRQKSIDILGPALVQMAELCGKDSDRLSADKIENIFTIVETNDGIAILALPGNLVDTLTMISVGLGAFSHETGMNPVEFAMTMSKSIISASVATATPEQNATGMASALSQFMNHRYKN